MVPRRVVVVFGGNAFVSRGAAPSAEGELAYARRAVACLDPFLAPGVELVVGHGNGPQVGHMLARVEASRGAAYAQPLSFCVADTEGELGLLLTQALHERLIEKNIRRSIATLFTLVRVDADDPAFAAPSKPIGRFLDAADAEALRRAGVAVREDAGRGFRRVVASPEPRAVLDLDVVRSLLPLDTIVVAGGGGGVPVVREGASLRAVDAVVDKDLTAALIADAIDADLLVILTDVPCAYLGWGTPSPSPIACMRAGRARALVERGAFAEGSMAPKIRACARFASHGARRAIVCDPPSLSAALEGRAGTTVVPDAAASALDDAWIHLGAEIVP